MNIKKARLRAKAFALLGVLALSVMPIQAQDNGGKDKTITLSYENRKLGDMLDELQRQSDYYRIQYVVGDVSPYTVSGNVSNMTVEQAVRNLIKDTPLSIEVKGNFIHVFNPQHTTTGGNLIKGRVYDRDGEPLIGVTVRNTDTGAATVTDVNGAFSLQQRPGTGGTSTLKFSYIGKKETQLKAGTGKAVNVIMEDDGKTLDDVVVTGYQTLSKERVTGSFDKVGQNVLANRPTSDLSSALQGVVAGMQPTENQDGSVNFLIRGTSSLYASSEPLVVVDGFPIEGTFSSINPNDVESVTVLKDAAAASIWGARSANGVIVVTTKKGQKGRLKVDVQGFLRLNTRQDLDYTLAQADSRTTVDYELEAIKKGWTIDEFTPSVTNIANPLSLVQEYYYANKYYGLSDADMNAALDRLRSTNNRGQIKKYLMQTQLLQQYNVSLSAGSDKYSTYASIMYEKNNEQTIRRGYERYLLNFNNQYKFNSWLTGTLSGTFQRREQDTSGPSLTDFAQLSPYEMILNDDGTYANQINSWNTLVAEQAGLKNLPYNDLSYNLLREVRGRDYNTKTTRYRVNMGLNAKLWRGLVFDTKFQYERNEEKTRKYDSEETDFVRQLVNYYTEYDLTNDVLKTQYIPKGGIIRPSDSSNENWVWRNQLSYNGSFGPHDISALAGIELSQYKTSSTTYPYVLGYDPETNTSQPAYYGSKTSPETIVGYPDYYGTLSSMLQTVLTSTCHSSETSVTSTTAATACHSRCVLTVQTSLRQTSRCAGHRCGHWAHVGTSRKSTSWTMPATGLTVSPCAPHTE